MRRPSVDALVTAEDWKRALTFAAQLRSRSFNDTMLIYAQRPRMVGLGPTHVWEVSQTNSCLAAPGVARVQGIASFTVLG